jgi:pimeloyl-ACP methyl ester carboxylesterase
VLSKPGRDRLRHGVRHLGLSLPLGIRTRHGGAFAMPFIETTETRLYYEVHGDGQPLVLAHGVGGNHASWFNQIASLSRRYRVIVFDARGFGRSADERNLGRDGFVGDLDALLSHLAVEKPILVGQSMGGGACLSFTCAFPQRVRGLVLADTLMGFVLPDEIRDFMADLEKRASQWSQLERVLGATFRAEQPALSVLYTQLASFNGVNVKTLRGVQRQHRPEDLAATGVPTLFLVGEEDALFPPRAVRAVQARVPGSQLIEMPRSGHSAYFERPSVFDRILTDWISGLDE